jgi:uncharacterized membrane protein
MKSPAIESATTAAIVANSLLAALELVYSLTRNRQAYAPKFQLILATGLLSIFIGTGLAARLKNFNKEPVVQISILLGALAVSIAAMITTSHNWISNLSASWIVVLYTLVLVAISVFRCTFSTSTKTTKPRREDLSESEVRTFSGAIHL